MFYVLQANNEKSIFRRCRRNCQILWITFTPFTSMDLTMKLPSKFDCVQLSTYICIRYYHMSSFGESKTKKILEDRDKGSQFVDYNCKQISRIYPGAKRQDSSNLKVGQPWTTTIWICIFRWSSHGRLVARSLLWTTRRTTGRTCSTAPCSPATGAVAIASNQGRSRFIFRS